MINGDYFKQFILKYVDEPLTEDDGQCSGGGDVDEVETLGYKNASADGGLRKL